MGKGFITEGNEERVLYRSNRWIVDSMHKRGIRFDNQFGNTPASPHFGHEFCVALIKGV